MNKYLEKIAELQKEAFNPKKLVQRLATRGGKEGTGREVDELTKRMRGKFKEHSSKIFPGLGGVNADHYTRMMKIDQNIGDIHMANINRTISRVQGPTASHAVAERTLGDLGLK